MKEFSKVVFTQAVLTSEAQEKVIQLAKKCFGGMHSNVCAPVCALQCACDAGTHAPRRTHPLTDTHECVGVRKHNRTP